MFFPASRPRNRKGINRLCSRAPEPAIETGQLSAFMICKPLQRVRTPFLLGHKEIFLLTRQSLLSITLLKRSALSLTDLGIHSTSQLSIPKIRKDKLCNSSVDGLRKKCSDFLSRRGLGTRTKVRQFIVSRYQKSTEL